MRKQCVRLRDAFVAAVEAPAEPWVKPGSDERQPYVELLYLHPEPVRMRGHFPDGAITDKGELMFGLAITFDRGRDSFPKENPYLRHAVRVRMGQPQYAFYNLTSEEVETPPGWVSEMSKFVELMLERLENYVNFDPFTGARDRAGIGFL